MKNITGDIDDALRMHVKRPLYVKYPSHRHRRADEKVWDRVSERVYVFVTNIYQRSLVR